MNLDQFESGRPALDMLDISQLYKTRSQTSRLATFRSFFSATDCIFLNDWEKLSQIGHNGQKDKLVNTVTGRLNTITGNMTKIFQQTKTDSDGSASRNSPKKL